MSTSGGGRTRPTLIGSVLDGRYRVGAVIARGGMSTVYRGMDLRLDRPVAIKVMKPSFASDPSFLTRFEREARTAAGLAHRGVVAVYDQGRDGEVVFLVMELIDGGTLRDLMRQSGALSVPVALSILEPLLAALGAAHAAGLVHRDVKPENVLISSKGEVKVADFGLVRAISSQTMATGDVILGTVAYLSPEQVSTGASDARSDVYSAGIVAFEMLTGHTPYLGDNAISVAYQHVHSDVPPVTDDAPGVPVELDDLILAATRRDPFTRPRDATAFLSALVSMRARLGLARAVVPVPRVTPPVPQVTPPANRPSSPARPGLRSGRPDTSEHTRYTEHTRHTSRADHRTVGQAGPMGTRMVPGVGAGTADLYPAGALGESTLPPPPVRRRRAPSRLRRWLIVMILVVLLGTAAAVGGWWLGSGRWAYAPAVVDIEQQQAETLVRDAGLVPRVSNEPNDTVPPGTVAGSDPNTGARVLRGSEIDLVVSTGRPVVPAISPGTAVTDAAQTITDAHLTPVFGADTDQYSNTVPIGTFVTTDPQPDVALAIAGDVTIVRSKGPAPTPVPQVAGKAHDDAENALLAAGFTTKGDQGQFDADVDPGTVIGTDPIQGELAPTGSAVALVVATSLEVPTVRGESLNEAADDLRRSGFVVTVGPPAFDGDIDGGLAIGTDPVAGIRIDPSDPAIVLTLSNAVAVPDVTRGNVGQARDQLTALGLQTAVSAMFGANGAPVIGQSPRGGSRVEPNSTVRITAFP